MGRQGLATACQVNKPCEAAGAKCRPLFQDQFVTASIRSFANGQEDRG